MATKTRITALILATFALMTTGVVVVPAAFAQDGNLDVDQSADQETGNVQVADATSEQDEANTQENGISQLEDMVNSLGGIGSNGGGAGAGGGITGDSSQGQTIDHPSQDNGAFFGDDLGISTALNAAQVNVDLRNLVNLTPPSTSTE
ncbi:MAG: hypothetical protein M3299_11140 [Thermoproteota archaeon]|nr:hypothetical protein [Thermoproteota archaeon]